MDHPSDRDRPESGRKRLLESGGLIDPEGLSRRKLLQLGGLGAGALALPGVLAACGGGGSTTGATTGGGGGGETAESPELTKLIEEITESQVIIANFGGTTEEARKKVFWEPFEKRTGVQVVSAEAGSVFVPMIMGEIPTKWDAVHGSIQESLAARNEGKKPLPDTPKAAWEDLVQPPKFQKYVWQSFFLARVPAMLKGTYSGAQPETWADFFDTKKFPGKRGWPAEYFIEGVFQAALMADGVPPEEVYPLDYERAKAKIASIFDDLVIYTEFPQAQTFLTSKAASMCMAPNGLWHELEGKGVELDVMWEATPIVQTNGMNIMPEPPNPKAVEALAVFCNEPKMQAEFAKLTGYGPPTKEAFEDLSPEEVEALPNSPQRTNLLKDDPVYLAKEQKKMEEENAKLFSEH
ncbi:MAG: extracellular solute-binding protein [Actinobacteria bacterium]|nr:extracellular solute-binding protein [Actinomycetota bacterium]